MERDEERRALRRAEGRCDVLITTDQNLEDQQPIHRTRITDLLPLIPATLSALATINPGDIVRIGS